MPKGWALRVAGAVIVLMGMSAPALSQGTPLAQMAVAHAAAPTGQVPQAKGMGGVDRLIVLVTLKLTKIKGKELLVELKAGKTLAQIAVAHKVKLATLRAAILKTLSTHLKARVARGMMTAQEEKAFYARVQSNLTKLLNQKFTNIRVPKNLGKNKKKSAHNKKGKTGTN